MTKTRKQRLDLAIQGRPLRPGDWDYLLSDKPAPQAGDWERELANKLPVW